MPLHPEPELDFEPHRSRIWLVVGLVFTSLLSIALGAVFLVQYENGRISAAKALSRPSSVQKPVAQPTAIPEVAGFADKIGTQDVQRPLSLRERILCDRVGTGARLLTILMGKGGDAKNIESLNDKLVALLDGRSMKERKVLKNAFKIIITGVRLTPGWTPEDQADIWRRTCRAQRWPTSNAQENLLSPASLTHAASPPPPSSPSAAQDSRRFDGSESSDEAKRAEALKYFCVNAMLGQISPMSSEELNQLNQESYQELARELGITEDQARLEFSQVVHYYGNADGVSQACANQGWLAANR